MNILIRYKSNNEKLHSMIVSQKNTIEMLKTKRDYLESELEYQKKINDALTEDIILKTKTIETLRQFLFLASFVIILLGAAFSIFK